MKRQSHRAGGFSLVVVVCMIAFAAMAVAATSANFVAETRRTRICGEASQLRQLLLAGTVAASQKLDGVDGSSPGFTEMIKLPDELISGGISGGGGETLRVVMERDPADANVRLCDITATFGKSEARQRVVFEHGKTVWVILDAELR